MTSHAVVGIKPRIPYQKIIKNKSLFSSAKALPEEIDMVQKDFRIPWTNTPGNCMLLD